MDRSSPPLGFPDVELGRVRGGGALHLAGKDASKDSGEGFKKDL